MIDISGGVPDALSHPQANQLAWDQMEKDEPELWRWCYPRIYSSPPADFHSPKEPARDVFSSVIKVRAGLVGDSEKAELSVSEKLAQLRMPLRWVARGVYEALAKTKLPPTVNWHTMQLPAEAMTFMLPKGVLKHSADGDIVCVSWARFAKGEVLKPRHLPVQHTYENDQFILLVRSQRGTLTHFVLDGKNKEVDTRAINALIDDPHHVAHRSEWSTLVMEPEDRQIITRAMHLMFGLVLLMTARPTVVEHGALQKRVKKGTEVREFWSPTIIGQHYKMRTAPAAAHQKGEHRSPRLHMVTGFWNLFHTGKGRTEERTSWIEPYWRGTDE